MSSVRILGPVEAWAGGERLVLGGPRQLALLAVLALRANRVVSSEVLVDALWGEERGGVRKRLQMAVARLRQALAPLDADGTLVRTVGGGYLLALPEGELDAEVFQSRLEEGRAALREGEPGRASELLSAALALWRGPPLAEVGYEEFAQAEIRRLEELRLLALEARVEAELQLGRHAGVIAELEGLLVEHPSRERIAGQLMVALYRSGRQADALEVYQRVRAHLAQELGLQPGPEVVALQARILESDATLLERPGVSGGDHPFGHRVANVPRIDAIPGRGRILPDVDRQLEGSAVSPVISLAASLPVPATPFLGRERELALVTGLMRKTRLLTLTGAGGSGKTRLALRLAETCRRDYSGGVAFVGFADINDAELIIPTISQALGLGEVPGKPDLDRLQERLAERELLLVLDNLEQLAPGTRALGDLLSRCPPLSMLVTSREPLHLAGEQQYEVPLLEPEDAIELFLTRARALAPDMSLDTGIVASICARLDRLPLAIELTATRTKLLSPVEILDRLNRHMPVAATGPRDAPQRQRTLKATIDWSYELLTPEEQQLFARLSVFAGGWTLTAAQTVCGADLDTLHALVDRSLVETDGERGWMLQTLRGYALERLERSREGETLRRAHAQFLVQLLEAEGLSQPGWPDTKSLARVAPEQENFTAALEWASRSGVSETLARLAESLVGVWVIQGRLHEAHRWMGLVLNDQENYSERLAAQVLSAAATLARQRGDHGKAAVLGSLALARWREVGDAHAIGLALNELAASARGTGRDACAVRALNEEAIEFARDNALTEALAFALAGHADLLMSIGNLTEARSLCEESRAISVTGSSEAWLAAINLGYIEMREGHHAEAARLGREALQSALARGDLLGLAWGAIFTAWSLAEQNQLGWSARLLGAALGFLKTAGATSDWMILACEDAALDLLRHGLDASNVEALFEEGRNRGLETVVRDVLSAAIPPIPGGTSQA